MNWSKVGQRGYYSLHRTNGDQRGYSLNRSNGGTTTTTAAAAAAAVAAVAAAAADVHLSCAHQRPECSHDTY